MIKKNLFAITLIVQMLTPLAAFAANDIRFLNMASVEIEQTNAKGEKVLIRKPAEFVPPGGIVIYTNSFTNTGQQQAEKLVINAPVAANTEYLSGSATETGFDVIFSADRGKSYGKPQELSVPDGKGGKRLAEPREFTNIRWTMQAPLQPGATGVVEFRVRVK